MSYKVKKVSELDVTTDLTNGKLLMYDGGEDLKLVESSELYQKVDNPNDGKAYALGIDGQPLEINAASGGGENMANAKLVTTPQGGVTQGAIYEWDTAGFPLNFKNVANKTSDSTFNHALTVDEFGQMGRVNIRKRDYSGLSKITNLKTYRDSDNYVITGTLKSLGSSSLSKIRLFTEGTHDPVYSELQELSISRIGQWRMTPIILSDVGVTPIVSSFLFIEDFIITRNLIDANAFWNNKDLFPVINILIVRDYTINGELFSEVISAEIPNIFPQL